MNEDRIETARGEGRNFPKHWGIPPGTSHSEERAAWVRRWARVQMVRDIDKRAAREIAEQIHADIANAIPDNRAH